MDATFNVTRESPEFSEAELTDQGSALSEHDRQLVQKAENMHTKNPNRRWVFLDVDAQEIRMAPDRKDARSGLADGVERIYYHQLAEIFKEERYVMVRLKDGTQRFFSGSTLPNSRQLHEVLKKALPAYALGMVQGHEASNRLWAAPLFTVWAAIVCMHVTLSPFTKVEESFNVQATYDLLSYPEGVFNRSVIRKHYDHIEFPGVVPRTFWGPLVLSSFASSLGASHFAKMLTEEQMDDRVGELILVRILLGVAFVVCSTLRLFAAARVAFPRTLVPLFFILLTMSQFHVPYYASRLLPNTFAMILTSLAHAELLENRSLPALALLIMATVIFRCDVLVLLAPTALQIFLEDNWEDIRRRRWKAIIRSGLRLVAFGLAWFIIALALTAAVDTHFWDKQFPYWPEGVVLYYNTVLNKSSNWGTQPFHWYFTTALPRSLLLAFPLCILGVREIGWRHRASRVILPSLLFVLLYSFLPHKEVRFLFPVLPTLTLSAAAGADAGLRSAARQPGSVALGVKMMLAAGLLLSFVAGATFTYVSSLNYPAAEALRWLHAHEPSGRVHIDPYSAMNGVSRFGYSPRFVYSKKERDIPYEQFDFLLTRNPDTPAVSSLFDIAHVQKGEPRLVMPSATILADKLAKGEPPLPTEFVRMENAVFVMKRKPSHSTVF